MKPYEAPSSYCLLFYIKYFILLLDKHYYKTASGLSAHNRLTVDGGLVHPIMLNYYTMA